MPIKLADYIPAVDHYQHLLRLFYEDNYDIITITAGSGVGKNYTINKLLKEHNNIYFPKSYTTRPKRGDKGDEDYVFIDTKDFKPETYIYDLEYPKNSGFHYGYQADEMIKGIKSHQKTVILVASKVKEQLRTWLNKTFPTKKIASVFWYANPKLQTARYCHRVGVENENKLPKTIHNVDNKQLSIEIKKLLKDQFKLVIKNPKPIDKLAKQIRDFGMIKLNDDNENNNVANQLYLDVVQTLQLKDLNPVYLNFIHKIPAEINQLVKKYPTNNCSLEDLNNRLAMNELDWDTDYDFIIDASNDIDNPVQLMGLKKKVDKTKTK